MDVLVYIYGSARLPSERRRRGARVRSFRDWCAVMAAHRRYGRVWLRSEWDRWVFGPQLRGDCGTVPSVGSW